MMTYLAEDGGVVLGDGALAILQDARLMLRLQPLKSAFLYPRLLRVESTLCSFPLLRA